MDLSRGGKAALSRQIIVSDERAGRRIQLSGRRAVVVMSRSLQGAAFCERYKSKSSGKGLRRREAASVSKILPACRKNLISAELISNG